MQYSKCQSRTLVESEKPNKKRIVHGKFYEYRYAQARK